MRNAAANLEFEEAARLRDEVKRLKLIDFEFANEVLTPAGEAVDRAAPKALRAEAAAEKAEVFRKGGGGGGKQKTSYPSLRLELRGGELPLLCE